MARTTNSLWHRIEVKRAGKRDGSLGIPARDDLHLSPKEVELLERGAGHLSQIESDYANKINSTIAKREESVTTFDRRVTEYEENQSKLARHWNGRDIDVKLSRRTYLALLFVIGAGEFVLNSYAFAVFGHSPAFTALASLAVALTLPILAHWTGIIVRQGFLPIGRTILVSGCLAAVIYGLRGITVARSEYLQTLNAGGHAPALEGAFFHINAMIFMATMAMSFFSHDQDSILEILTRRAEQLDGAMDRLDSHIDILGGRVDTLRDRKQADSGRINATIQQLIQLYRRTNLHQRAADDRPELFKSCPAPIEPIRVAAIQKQSGSVLIEAIRERRRRATRAVSDRQLRDENAPLVPTPPAMIAAMQAQAGSDHAATGRIVHLG